MKTTECALHELAVGQSAQVLEVKGVGAVAQRLLEMGLVPGAACSIVRFAPLGDPIEITLDGYHLSLRKAEAAQIRVRLCQ